MDRLGRLDDLKPLKPSAAIIRKLQRLAPEFQGKIAAIEPRSGAWFIADTVIEAAKKGRKKYPKASFYFIRIGYPAVDYQGGGLLKS